MPGQEISSERRLYSFTPFLSRQIKHAEGHLSNPFSDKRLKIIHLFLMWLAHPEVKAAILTSYHIDPVYQITNNLCLPLCCARNNLSYLLLLFILTITWVYRQITVFGGVLRKHLHEGNSLDDAFICQLFYFWLWTENRTAEHEAINHDKIWNWAHMIYYTLEFWIF